MRVLRIPAKHQAKVAAPPRICRRLDPIPRRPRISSFTSWAFPRAWSRCYRHVHLTRLAVAAWCRFAEKRCRMRSNGKLVFNIRISTEDEINGTVKGDV